jgi:tetratricopeptide (TPR) repeat protein
VPLVVTLVAGCATRTTSSPFIIRRGSGPVDVGHGAAPTKVERAAVEHARREALARRAATAPAALPSVERADPALRSALASLGRAESAAAHIRVAQQYWRLHVYDAAYDHYSDAIRLDGRNVEAWEGRSRIWREWHMTGLALADIHRARYFGPGRSDVLNTLGTILEQAGQCRAARDAYSAALQVDASADWARDNISRLEARGCPVN